MANALQHIPRCRLLDCHGLGQSHTRDALAPAGVQIHGQESLGREFDRAVGEDGSRDDPKHSATVLASLSASIAEVMNFVAAVTAGAYDIVKTNGGIKVVHRLFLTQACVRKAVGMILRHKQPHTGAPLGRNWDEQGLVLPACAPRGQRSTLVAVGLPYRFGHHCI